MMLGEDQHAALVAALRNQPQYPRGNAAPSAQSIMQNGEALAAGYQDIKNSGKSDAQQYADEFGQYDPQFAAQQAQQPDEGSFMNGLQNKWNGLFGGASG
jgi:hypothetical protein